MNKEGLMLYPGGKLIRTRWLYDEILSMGSYIDEDVTSHAHTYLFEPTDLHADVTLQDLFTLLEKNPVIQAMQQRNFIGTLMSEYMKTHAGVCASAYGTESIEYLELYHVWEKNSATKEVTMASRPNFQGVGFELKENVEDAGSITWKKGERRQWGVSFSPLHTLLPLPLRHNKTVTVFEGDRTSPSCGKVLEKLVLESANLGTLIEGVLWELSFHGSEEDKQALVASSTFEAAQVQINFDFDAQSGVTG